MTQNVRSVVAVCVFAVVCSVTLLVLYALTPPESRIDLLDHITNAVPVILAGIPGVLAYMRAKEAAQVGHANNKALNGALDQRMTDAATLAVATYMEARQPSRSTDVATTEPIQPPSQGAV